MLIFTFSTVCVCENYPLYCNHIVDIIISCEHASVNWSAGQPDTQGQGTGGRPDHNDAVRVCEENLRSGKNRKSKIA